MPGTLVTFFSFKKKNVGITHSFYNEQVFLLELETKHMSWNRGMIKLEWPQLA